MASNFEFGGFRQNVNERDKNNEVDIRKQNTPIPPQTTHKPKRHYFNMVYELSEPTSPTRTRPVGKIYKTELCDEEDTKSKDEELTL